MTTTTKEDVTTEDNIISPEIKVNDKGFPGNVRA